MVGGGNNYKLQNIGKAKLRWEGRLPIDIRCSDEALEITNAHLRGDNDHVVRVIEDEMDEMGE